jgi:hypothetical protein
VYVAGQFEAASEAFSPVADIRGYVQVRRTFYFGDFRPGRQTGPGYNYKPPPFSPFRPIIW